EKLRFFTAPPWPRDEDFQGDWQPQPSWFPWLDKTYYNGLRGRREPESPASLSPYRDAGGGASMKRRPAVALLIETSNAYARGLLKGIVGYVREHRPWSIYLPEQRRGDAPPAWLARWRGNGLIARVENGAIARAVRATGRPVVDVSAARLLP